MKWPHVFLGVALGAGVILTTSAWAQSPPAAGSQRTGPLCGVYCVYAAARLLDAPVQLEALVQPQFIGACEGSSLAELHGAVTALSLNAQIRSHLSVADLQSVQHPLILHVRSYAGAGRYDHFVLYAGSRQGKAVIIDGPQPPQLLTFGEVARMWSGSALAVSGETFDRREASRATSRVVWVHGALALVCIATVRLIVGQETWFHEPRLVGSLYQCALLLGCGAAMGTAYHCVSAAGYWHDPGALREIEEWHTDAFLPSIDVDELRRELEDGSVVLVDARSDTEFRRGRIKGALHLPERDARRNRGKNLARVAKAKRIVVYCDNAQCPAARRVAQVLISDGFSNVYVLREGWSEWQAEARR